MTLIERVIACIPCDRQCCLGRRAELERHFREAVAEEREACLAIARNEAAIDYEGGGIVTALERRVTP